METPEHIKRIKQELTELVQRQEKLIEFMGSDTWLTLRESQKILLRKQNSHMHEYAMILRLRVDHEEALANGPR